MEPVLTGLDETAEKVGLPRHVLWKMAKSRRVPAYRMGKFWFFKIEELVEFLKCDVNKPEATSGTDTKPEATSGSE
jgi:hypothetical protein